MFENEPDDKLQLVLSAPHIGEAAKRRARAVLDARAAAKAGAVLRPAPSAVPALAAPPSMVDKVRARRRGKTNATERRYEAAFLAPRLARGESRGYSFEPATWHDHDTGLRYTPDWLERMPWGLWGHEVKGGHVYEKDVLRFLAVAAAHPWMRWTLAQWKGGTWTMLHDLGLRPPVDQPG